MSLKQFFCALFLCTALLQVGLRCAKADVPYEVTLEDEFGNSLPTFHHRGEVFAMGEYGRRYNVRVKNRTNVRVEAVVTVDGRDVVSGQPGDFKRQRGYLIEPRSSVLIEGFRTSDHQVAAFRFTSPGNSYSARMGTPENVGIIGAAFFPERVNRPRRPALLPRTEPSAPRKSEAAPRAGSGSSSAERSRAPASAPSAAPAESAARESGSYYDDSLGDHEASNIGTEYGEARYSSVVEVPFTRARSSPDRVITLRYDDRAGLERRGIITRPRPRPYDPGPVAFPMNRYAPPPPPRTWE